MSAREFFSEEERAEIEMAISDAEKITSGEIRVHLENTCDEDVLDHAAWIFEKLEMEKTEKRNGVLIYLAVDDHNFAIIGDAGINEVVPKDFWENTIFKMRSAFIEDRFKEGVIEAVRSIGSDLKSFFPKEKENKMSCQMRFLMKKMRSHKPITYRSLINESLLKSFLLVVFSMSFVHMNAQEEGCLPEKPSASTPASKAYVHDLAGSFTSGQRAQLNSNFKRFKEATF